MRLFTEWGLDRSANPDVIALQARLLKDQALKHSGTVRPANSNAPDGSAKTSLNEKPTHAGEAVTSITGCCAALPTLSACLQVGRPAQRHTWQAKHGSIPIDRGCEEALKEPDFQSDGSRQHGRGVDCSAVARPKLQG